MTANIVDIFTRHGHFVERYKTGQYKRFAPFLERVRKDLILELSKSQTIRSQKILRRKLKDLEAMINHHLKEFTDSFSEQLDLFAVSEAGFGMKALGNDFDAPTPSLQRLKIAIHSRPFNNKLLRDALNDFSKQQARMIRDAVSMGFFEGKTTTQIIRDIIGTNSANFKDGLLQVTRNSASRMVRTAINHVSNVAKDRLYKENIDLISHYEWISTLDSRTSDICTSLDGNIYRVGKGRLPPAHPNCRSTTSPVLFDDPKTKDSL